MSPSPKFFSKKLFFWMLGIFLLLASLTVATFFLGKRFAGEILNEVVLRETNGYYGLSFQSIEFDILEKRFRVNDLLLSIDTSRDLASLNIRNAYEVKLRELVIELESLREFYFNKELLMQNVRVVDPDIQMVPVGVSEQQQTFSFEAGNMYQAISDYLKVLKIDYFRIQEGKLQYGANTFSLGNIDFLVKNLLMDSVNRGNQVFYSETIKLEISNQKFHLPDSIHEVTFDRFLLSTEDSILTFENFRVQPVEGSGVSFEGKNELNVYDIHVPKLSFKGIDYVSAYQKNHLIIDELRLDEPTVFVDDETHAAATAKDKDNSLLSLLFQVFGAIDIGTLQINQAHLDLKANAKGKKQRFKVEESDIVFYNIHLDTANFRFNSREKYFDDIELDIHNYTYLLPDSVHTVRFERLNVNSFTSEIRLDSVEVTHERAGNEAKLLISAKLPQLLLTDIDYQRAITEGVLPIGRLKLAGLDINIRNTGVSEKNGPLDLRSVYQTMRPIFRELTLDEIDLRNMRLTLPKGIYLGDIDLNFQGIRLNSATGVFSDLYTRADLRISDFIFDRDSIKLSGKKLHSDHSLSTYDLVDWEVNVETGNTSVSGAFDTLRVTGMNVDSLVLGNYTTFKRAILTNPDFRFAMQSNSDTARSAQPLALGIEKELIVRRGKITGMIDSTQITFDELNADVFVGDSTAFRRLSAQDISIRAADFNHLLTVGVWSFDTLDGHMYFRDLHLHPLDASDTSGLLLGVDIPLISLMDFEQSEFFDKNHLYASDFYLQQPKINVLSLDKQGKKDSTQGKKPFFMALDKFRIDEGSLALSESVNALDSINVSGINTELHGLKFPREDPFENGAIFYTDSVMLEIGKILPFLSSKDSLEVGHVRFDSERTHFRVDAIHYSKADATVGLTIPKLELSGLDVEKLYRKKGFKVDTLMLSGVSGFNKRKEKRETSPSFSFPTDIRHLSFAQLNWVYEDTLSDNRYAFNNVDISSDGLLLEDTFKLENLESYAEKVQVAGGPFELPVSDDYTLLIDRYLFDYPGSTVALEDFELKPTKSKEVFSANLETQNDWFDVAVDKITLSKVDVIKAVTEQNYVIGKIDLSGIDALIYRDKGVPFPEDQVRSLPQSELRAINADFRVDSLLINGRVRYQEKPENYSTYGEISFDDLNGTLTNIKNLEIGKEDIMTLHATGKLMDAGVFEVESRFMLDHPYDRFTFKGAVRDFPLDSMNRMLGPVGNLNIKSGFSEELTFDFVANDSLSRGEMRFRYDDLKIQILNKQTHDTHGLGQGIKTFFANTFVVKNKNPSFLVFVRKGVIFQQRDTSRAVFNYWGKALLSGAVSSIGIHKSDKAAKRFQRKIEVE